MKRPYFSIVIPTLNEAHYLPNLLANIQAQTATNFEVIVVDGGSTDQTLEIAAGYQPYFPLQLVISQKRNVAFQRNKGAKQAHGTYLIFLDADVAIPAHFLALLELQLRARPVAIASTRYMCPGITFDRIFTGLSSWAMSISIKLKRPFVPGHNFIIRRSVFKKLKGFDATIVHGEDCELVQRAVTAHFSVRVFPNPLCFISQRRFEKDGRLSTASKYVYATCYQLLSGPIRQTLFAYKMGGE